MKNKEKFMDKIVDIACNDGRVAVDVVTNTPVDCNSIDCSSCLFHGKDGCSSEMFNWSEQEYETSVTISSNDMFFLSFIKDKFEYMARDKNGLLYAHEVNPKKYKQYGLWVGEDAIGLYKFNVDFPMVKYTDDVAWKISDLKELKIVENY